MRFLASNINIIFSLAVELSVITDEISSNKLRWVQVGSDI